jgi:hypothetical protein
MAALADWNFPYGTDRVQDPQSTTVDLLFLRRSDIETSLE